MNIVGILSVDSEHPAGKWPRNSKRVKLAVLHAVEEIKKTNRIHGNLGKPVPDHDLDWCMAVDADYSV